MSAQQPQAVQAAGDRSVAGDELHYQLASRCRTGRHGVIAAVQLLRGAGVQPHFGQQPVVDQDIEAAAGVQF